MPRPIDPNSKRQQRLQRRELRDQAVCPQWILDKFEQHARGEQLHEILFPTGNMAVNARHRFYMERKNIVSQEGHPLYSVAATALALTLVVRCTVCDKDPRHCEHRADSSARLQFLALPAELMSSRFDDSKHDHLEPQIGTGAPAYSQLPIGAPEEEGDNFTKLIEGLGYGSKKQEPAKPAPAHQCIEWDEYDICVEPNCRRPKP